MRVARWQGGRVANQPLLPAMRTAAALWALAFVVYLIRFAGLPVAPRRPR